MREILEMYINIVQTWHCSSKCKWLWLKIVHDASDEEASIKKSNSIQLRFIFTVFLHLYAFYDTLAIKKKQDEVIIVE